MLFFYYIFSNSIIILVFAYKGALLQADQKYIADLVRYVTGMVTVCIQIILLLVYKSFILYLMAEIVFNILKNFYIAKKLTNFIRI